MENNGDITMTSLSSSRVDPGHPLADDPDLRQSQRRWDQGQYYNWRTHFPRDGKVVSFLHWFRSGFGSEKERETDDQLHFNLRKLASLLKLLREYYSLYGMPAGGGPNDQEFVLREVLKDLYAGGGPIWTLEKAMERAAEGLTGKKGVDVGMLPRKAFVYTPTTGHLSMFRIQSGFDIQRLAAAEKILVRIASFASNTHGFSSLPSRLPAPSELLRAAQSSDLSLSIHGLNQRAMATRILDLASCAEGLFFFVNSSDRPDTSVHTGNDKSSQSMLDPSFFWKVEDHISELFSRLATMEAMQMLDDADRNKKVLYSRPLQLLFRFMASAGACAFWFNGSWLDTAVSGVCGLLVGIISGWSFLAKEDRIVFESIASALVGLIAGLLSCLVPSETCFIAISISGVLDILQGFRVVYSVIEVMGKHSVAGGADFLEGLLYTALISFFLRVGMLIAEAVTGRTATQTPCSYGINEAWYFLLVPAAAVSWSGMCNPEYEDLRWMAFHGVLAFVATWVCEQAQLNSEISLFLAAFVLSLSSGLVSRFTGRQAIGNTIAGLFVLVPGAYLVSALFSNLTFDFIGPVIVNAAIIGTGAWSGTIVCSPTIVGTTAARLRKGTANRRSPVERSLAGPILFFLTI
jgi:uncharacterized membrane protein YjjP (DUF1212 family)